MAENGRENATLWHKYLLVCLLYFFSYKYKIT